MPPSPGITPGTEEHLAAATQVKYRIYTVVQSCVFLLVDFLWFRFLWRCPCSGEGEVAAAAAAAGAAGAATAVAPSLVAAPASDFVLSLCTCACDGILAGAGACLRSAAPPLVSRLSAVYIRFVGEGCNGKVQFLAFGEGAEGWGCSGVSDYFCIVFPGEEGHQGRITPLLLCYSIFNWRPLSTKAASYSSTLTLLTPPAAPSHTKYPSSYLHPFLFLLLLSPANRDNHWHRFASSLHIIPFSSTQSSLNTPPC
ncbi:hypothetical protein E2C01_057346 [Portunus trituberculatus]|uniref:Uncharacterized protein n=1 Tax=Portunus trituberculatus TaxID=210409 RepID=A0A5B7GSN4_PORTR|nr:hypothetical protein [Portunus trituberculatus]